MNTNQYINKKSAVSFNICFDQDQHIQNEDILSINSSKFPFLLDNTFCKECLCDKYIVRPPINLPIYPNSLCWCGHLPSFHHSILEFPPPIKKKRKKNPRLSSNNPDTSYLCNCLAFSRHPITSLCYCRHPFCHHPLVNNSLVSCSMKQIGPCCAATSVAIACNSLNVHQSFLSQDDIMQFYKNLTRKHLLKQRWKLSQLLGDSRLTRMEGFIHQSVTSFDNSSKNSLYNSKFPIFDYNINCGRLPKQDMYDYINWILREIDDSVLLDFNKDIQKYLISWYGYSRLCDLIYSSTANIGNESICSVCNQFDNITSQIFFSSSSKSNIQIKECDSKDIQNEQWNILKKNFTKTGTAMIYHLKNHYAPIFAIQEYKIDTDYVCREVLASRRGQRPVDWISWDEIRATLIQWTGYGIISLNTSNIK